MNQMVQKCHKVLSHTILLITIAIALDKSEDELYY